MVSLTSKKINLRAIVLEVVRILNGNPEKETRAKKMTRNWSSKIESIDSNERVYVSHPEGYGLVFQLKTGKGSSVKIEIRATITFRDENIWENLTKSERETLYPSLKINILASHPPKEIAREIVGKILANYIKYFDITKERILEEEKRTLKMRTDIVECSEIVGGNTKGRGFTGHTEKGYSIIGVPAEKQGCLTIKIEDVEPEKVKKLLRMLVSED